MSEKEKKTKEYEEAEDLFTSRLAEVFVEQILEEDQAVNDGRFRRIITWNMKRAAEAK